MERDLRRMDDDLDLLKAVDEMARSLINNHHHDLPGLQGDWSPPSSSLVEPPIRVWGKQLYQQCSVFPAERCVTVTANGLVLSNSKKPRRIWPRLYCDNLRDVVMEAVRANAFDILRRSETMADDNDGESVEVAGDILVNPNQTADGNWEVAVVVCENAEGTNTSSVPSCDRKRRCRNDSRRRRTWTQVGEFHSHPEHDPAHIKPPSDLDLYQLTVATLNGVHSCMAVISYEGIYWYSAPGTVLRRFCPEIDEYYRMFKYNAAEQRESLRQCRQPIVEYVPPTLPFLYWMFRQLRADYRDLMNRRDLVSKLELVTEFHHLISRYGYSPLFCSWQRHPHTWSCPADAQTAFVLTPPPSSENYQSTQHHRKSLPGNRSVPSVWYAAGG